MPDELAELSPFPDRDPSLFYDLAKDQLGTQLATIDALDNKIGMLVGLGSALLGIVAAVFALTASASGEPISTPQACTLAATGVAYAFVAYWGVKAYFCRNWNIGPKLQQVWDDLLGDATDERIRWGVANSNWAFRERNLKAENTKADALTGIFVAVVIQAALVGAALALVALEV
jgi:hypothetical protein